MSGVIESLERERLRRVPAFQAGDRLRVHFQVVEGTRRRTQVFDGVVIKRQGSGFRETFTVRKQSFGVGVERTFPLHSPKIERIEVVSRGDVRRSKLYYLRGRVGPPRSRPRAPLRRPDHRRGAGAAGAAGGRRGGGRGLDAEGSIEEAEPVDLAPAARPSPVRRARGQGRQGEARDRRGAAAEPTRAEAEAKPTAEPEAGRRRRDGRAGRRLRGRRPGLVVATLLRRRERKPKAEDEGHGSLLELVMIVVVALGLALTIQAFLVKPFRIPSGSMLPTLDLGQRVLVDRVSYRFSDPDRGDIVVFKPPKGADIQACGNPQQPGDGHPCSKETPERSDQNFIKRDRRPTGRPPEGDRRPRLHQRQAPGRALHRQGPRSELLRVRPPEGDHDSTRSLFYDGRQS